MNGYNTIIFYHFRKWDNFLWLPSSCPGGQSPFHTGWLVVLGFNGPLRQYFSLYRAVSQREGERGERIDESKNVQTTPTRTYCKRNRPLPYCNQNCRTPRHWKFTQHLRTTRPPHSIRESTLKGKDLLLSSKLFPLRVVPYPIEK